jgi:AcrR family transcriptional regulator
MDTTNKIYSKAEEMFMRYGVKSVTMDDLSRAIGISKKTLYQSVENKEDLINKVITFILMKEAKVMGVIRTKAKDAIEEVVMISRHVNKMLQAINPAAMYDLQKYYTQQFDLMRSLNDQMVYTIIKENMDKGIKEGFYRNNFNTEIIAKLYVGQADLIIDTQIFPTTKYDLMNVHREFVMHHLYSITTEKGKERLETIFQD